MQIYKARENCRMSFLHLCMINHPVYKDVRFLLNSIHTCKMPHKSHKEGNKFYLEPCSHISVIKVSPAYTGRRNRYDIPFTMFGSPLQIQTDLMIAPTTNPSVHNPCNIGCGNLQHGWHSKIRST